MQVTSYLQSLSVGTCRRKSKRARLLLNRARYLIIHDPAHRGANSAAMPTDEHDQDGHFLFNHPEMGDYPAA